MYLFMYNRFIVTELCSGTLEDYFIKKYQGPVFVIEWEMLRQVTTGLDHLHRLKIVHRDIKPTNILISAPVGFNPILKLADFGISKALQSDRDNFTNTNKINPNGTSGWMAPEVYETDKCDSMVDIFALGLIFVYILTEGNKHPFGNDCNERILRIKRKEPMLIFRKDLKKPYSKHYGTFKLIKSMLRMEPLKRPTITNVKGRLREIARPLNLFDRVCDVFSVFILK